MPNPDTFGGHYITLGRHTDECLDNVTLCPNGSTLSFWFKAEQQAFKWPRLFTSTTYFFYFRRLNDGRLSPSSRVQKDVQWHMALPEEMPVVTTNEWHMISFTFGQASGFKLYYDGCTISSLPRLKQTNPQLRDFEFGCASGGNCPKIHYDEFRFWTSEKSPRFISWLWQFE